MTLYSQIISEVKKAGDIILSAAEHHDISKGITEKSGIANFVTLYDVMVQKQLISAFEKIIPSAKYVAEESNDENQAQEKLQSGYTFIIDPIDGTTNFIKGYNHSCISVALAYKGEIVFGVVYNPYAKELFYAEKDKGAYLNDKKICVSDNGLENGIVAFGTTPYHRERAEETLGLVNAFFHASLDVRRSGSAALDICYVANGRTNLFFELQLMPWDYAAGSIILIEAGGKITTMQNTSLLFHKPCSVLAGTATAHSQALDIIDNI